MSRPEDIVDVLLAVTCPAASAPRRGQAPAFVAEAGPSGTALARRVREAVHAIMTMSRIPIGLN